MVAKRDKIDLLVIIAEGSTATVFFLFIVVLLGLRASARSGKGIQALLVVTIVLVPAAIATLWMLGALRRKFGRREARAVAAAFAIVTPISLGVAMVLAELTGGYASFFGPAFGLVGAVLGAVILATLIDFVLCLLTMSFTRHLTKFEPTP